MELLILSVICSVSSSSHRHNFCLLIIDISNTAYHYKYLWFLGGRPSLTKIGNNPVSSSKPGLTTYSEVVQNTGGSSGSVGIMEKVCWDNFPNF